MFGRIVIFAYSVASYGVFLASFAYAVCFIGNFAVPRSIDVGGPAAPIGAAVVDLLLLGAFALQHSLMARPAFKRLWTRIVPPAAERSTYVLLSSVLLLALFWWWRPIPAVVWRAEGVAAAGLAALFWFGWIVALTSSFMIDHFELFGLSQGYAALRAVPAQPPAFTTRWLYRVVRHPIMLGFLVAFWSAPVMTLGHILFAAASTAYIVVGVWLEERDLTITLGEPYERYRRRVAMLVPGARRRSADTCPRPRHDSLSA